MCLVYPFPFVYLCACVLVYRICLLVFFVIFWGEEGGGDCLLGRSRSINQSVADAQVSLAHRMDTIHTSCLKCPHTVCHEDIVVCRLGEFLGSSLSVFSCSGSPHLSRHDPGQKLHQGKIRTGGASSGLNVSQDQGD